MKAFRAIIGVLAVVAILWAVYHAVSKLKSGKVLAEANALYERATTTEDFMVAQKAYEDVLVQGGPRAAKKLAEAGVAGCKAHMAYFNARTKGSLAKHKEAVDRMKEVSALTGDAEGIWTPRIKQFEQEVEAMKGPSLEEMRKRLAAGRAKAFSEAMSDIEALYRWKARWQKDGLYQDDKDRAAVLADAGALLLDGYCAVLEEDVKAAKAVSGKKSENALNTKVRVLGDLQNVERFDNARADAYRKQHADVVAEAKEAVKLLEAMAK